MGEATRREFMSMLGMLMFGFTLDEDDEHELSAETGRFLGCDMAGHGKDETSIVVLERSQEPQEPPIDKIIMSFRYDPMTGLFQQTSRGSFRV